MRARDIYRRMDTTNYVPERCGNLGIEAERKAETDAQLGSASLLRATEALFRKWEHRHGFVEGAAETLLLRGWTP